MPLPVNENAIAAPERCPMCAALVVNGQADHHRPERNGRADLIEFVRWYAELWEHDAPSAYLAMLLLRYPQATNADLSYKFNLTFGGILKLTSRQVRDRIKKLAKRNEAFCHITKGRFRS